MNASSHALAIRPKASPQFEAGDDESEKYLLGYLACTEGGASAVWTRLSAQLFFHRHNRVIFEAIEHLRERAEPVDNRTIAAALVKLGTIGLAGGHGPVADLVADYDNRRPEYYIGRLEEAARLRLHYTAARDFVREIEAGGRLDDCLKLRAEAESRAPLASWHSLTQLLDARRYAPGATPPPCRILYRLGEAVIATSGNLMGVQAQAKAGKTSFLGALIAATLRSGDGGDANAGEAPTNPGHGDCLGVAASHSPGHALIHFDTEQSPHDHYRGLETAFKRANLSPITHDPTKEDALVQCTYTHPQSVPAWFRSYHLADVPTAQRRAAVAAEMDRAAREHGGIHAVLLDGIGDFVTDPNDPAESFGFIEELHQLAIRFDCVIVCVLHENPGGLLGKMRGHLGSQLERKAETNLRMEKDGEGVVTLFAERARHAHIPKSLGPRFEWSSRAGMHVSVRDDGSARLSPAARKRQKIHERLLFVARQVFSEPQRWGDAVDLIARAAKVQTRRGIDIFKQMQEEEIVFQNEEKLWALAS